MTVHAADRSSGDATQPADAPQPVIALVRHGETDWNLARRIQGRTDIPLNDTGRAQARATAAALAASPEAPKGWAAVRSSPLGRAAETAAIIAEALRLPEPAIDAALWERNFGEAEGVDVETAKAKWPGLDGIPGADPVSELAERTSGALSRLLHEHPGSIVVAHGAMLRSGLSHLTGVAMPRILNGEVWLLHHTASGYVVARHERADHAAALL